MTDEYIKRSDAIKAVDNLCHVYFPANKAKLEAIPAVDVAPVVHGKYHSRGKRTNADKIRTMTNEELAETITKDWCSIVCPGGSFFCDGDCVTKITEWLKQEVK